MKMQDGLSKSKAGLQNFCNLGLYLNDLVGLVDMSLNTRIQDNVSKAVRPVIQAPSFILFFMIISYRSIATEWHHKYVDVVIVYECYDKIYTSSLIWRLKYFLIWCN